jgi:hypothetical protein
MKLFILRNYRIIFHIISLVIYFFTLLFFLPEVLLLNVENTIFNVIILITNYFESD